MHACGGQVWRHSGKAAECFPCCCCHGLQSSLLHCGTPMRSHLDRRRVPEDGVGAGGVGQALQSWELRQTWRSCSRPGSAATLACETCLLLVPHCCCCSSCTQCSRLPGEWPCPPPPPPRPHPDLTPSSFCVRRNSPCAVLLFTTSLRAMSPRMPRRMAARTASRQGWRDGGAGGGSRR